MADNDMADRNTATGPGQPDDGGAAQVLVDLHDVTRTVLLADDEELHILRGVTLRISAGDHLAIVGRSGCGKSTLLNLLGLLDVPTSGSLDFFGRPVGSMSSNARARLRGATVGFVFQQFNLLPGRTALENVAMPLLYAKGRDFWRRNELAMDMLDRVGLASRAGTAQHMLSGGEQQRVAIARALVRRPRLILADEPTGALDVATGQSVMELLEGVAEESGAALVTITHDPNVASRARTQYALQEGALGPAVQLAQVGA